MLSLLRSVATVIVSQPFYTEEIRAIHGALKMVSIKLPVLDRFHLD